MILRALNPETDEHLFRQAWAWRLSYPRLVRRWDGFKHFRQWFALMKRRVSVGIFSHGLIAIATLRPAAPDVYEAHIDCKRGVDLNKLAIGLLSIEKTVFEQWQATEIFVGVISRNRGIIQIAEACGFRRDGVEEQIGKLRWVRMRITKDEYDTYRQGHIRYQEHIRESTGSRVAGHRSVA